MTLGFMQNIWKMRWYWRIWVALLVLFNAVIPMLFIDSLEAQIVLTTFAMSASIQMYIFHHKGFVRLLGLGHILWLPMITWLLIHNSDMIFTSLFGIWMIILMIINSLSLCIDAFDVWRYWHGECSELT